MKIIYLGLVLAGLAGYISNFANAFDIESFATMSAHQAIELTGVFLPPMGAFVGIVGWF